VSNTIGGVAVWQFQNGPHLGVNQVYDLDVAHLPKAGKPHQKNELTEMKKIAYMKYFSMKN
jgi:hypothetical protein